MTTVPTASGDAMTFADMLEQFNEAYAEFQEDFWDTYGRIVDMLNGALRSAADFVQDLLPFGIGGDTIDQAVDKWNNELSPALVQGMEEIQEQLSQAVNDLAGNPGNLQIWAENFVTARESIFRQRNYAEVAADVEGAWAGRAFDKYSTVAGVQHDHLELLSNALLEGAQLTSAAAHKILELWRKLLHEFLSYGTDIINLLASATDAGKILTLEVPVVLEAIAVVWQKVVDIADLLLEFMTSQATTDSLNWLALAGTAGGLAGNEWPLISESASDTINDPDSWTPQTA